MIAKLDDKNSDRSKAAAGLELAALGKPLLPYVEMLDQALAEHPKAPPNLRVELGKIETAIYRQKPDRILEAMKRRISAREFDTETHWSPRQFRERLDSSDGVPSAKSPGPPALQASWGCTETGVAGEFPIKNLKSEIRNPKSEIQTPGAGAEKRRGAAASAPGSFSKSIRQWAGQRAVGRGRGSKARGFRIPQEEMEPDPGIVSYPWAQRITLRCLAPNDRANRAGVLPLMSVANARRCSGSGSASG
ncbi:MAG TPA: hypothetical protein VMY42_24610 [Thermoguttaceae bacterium]|nr:hypothetical protein [Thermoguttaceae bacterium]